MMHEAEEVVPSQSLAQLVVLAPKLMDLSSGVTRRLEMQLL